MSDNLKMVLLVFTMAAVTYLIRVIPFAFFRKRIKSRYVNSVMHYMPFAVLAAMTFPYVFYSTGNFYTALVGTGVAIIAALCKRSMLTVAILACIAVFISGFIIA